MKIFSKKKVLLFTELWKIFRLWTLYIKNLAGKWWDDTKKIFLTSWNRFWWIFLQKFYTKTLKEILIQKSLILAYIHICWYCNFVSSIFLTSSKIFVSEINIDFCGFYCPLCFFAFFHKLVHPWFSHVHVLLGPGVWSASLRFKLLHCSRWGWDKYTMATDRQIEMAREFI